MPSPVAPSPPPSPLVTPTPLPPCIQPAVARLAPGVSSSNPVVLLATGLNGPDDLLYLDADGTVLVGEHGDGHLAKVGGAARLTLLPQVVPQAEGIARIGSTIYVADQVHNRVVALTAGGVRTVLQLVPDPNGLNLDGIDSNGTQLVVPDSPHGTVLFVDPSGRVTARVGGFGRPAGVWANSTGHGGRYLVADENLNAVFELSNAGGFTRLAGNLPGVDDVVRNSSGHALVTLPGLGIVRDITSGSDIARGLRNPQGLGFDGAQNLLVTESDAGRLDLVVTTFTVQVPAGTVQLVPGQAMCLGILRAPGFTSTLNIEATTGLTSTAEPSSAATFEVVPDPCALPVCTVTVVVGSPVGHEFAYFSYRD